MRNMCLVPFVTAFATCGALAQRFETSFTYQGVLQDDGQPASGAYDLAFDLFDAPMAGLLRASVCHDNVAVVDGLFTVELDFGSATDGKAHWLAVKVRPDTTVGNCDTTTGYVTLSPRQPISPAPYALALPALRIENAESDFAPNIIGGWQGNTITPGAFAATIVGGGGMGFEHTAEGGGFIGGGLSNTAGEAGVVAGGSVNVAGELAVVAGGNQNTASGQNAAIPGGNANRALGAYSLAAGRNAGALHDNSFLWSDGLTMETTAARQFVISARNGAAINTTPRAANLTVATSNQWRWDIGNGWGDFAIGDETRGLAIGVATTGGGAGTVRMWPKGGAEGLIIGTPTAGDVIAVSRDGRTHIGAGGDGITVTSDGRVGIGVTSPAATFLLSVNGQAGKPGGGSWAVFSDERLKQDIQPMSGTLDRLLTLRGYEFAYTQDAIERGLGAEGPQFGLLAGEVEEVFPDWVGKGPDGMKYISERAHTALLVEALRDLRAEKDDQIHRHEEMIERQQRQIDDLRRELHRLADLVGAHGS
ncbi:MAG: tail fiber domain-containing protein [Phycisphaerales bacterium JB039]